jgi:hypothetical protein
VLAAADASVLLQRRRSRRKRAFREAIVPEPDERTTGKTLHAQDLISCIAGVWLFISPWDLGQPRNCPKLVSGSNSLCGAIITNFALAAYYRATPAEELVIGAIAFCVFVSRWVTGSAGIPAAMHWSD